LLLKLGYKKCEEVMLNSFRHFKITIISQNITKPCQFDEAL
jgi:hypothetical protein